MISPLKRLPREHDDDYPGSQPVGDYNRYDTIDVTSPWISLSGQGLREAGEKKIGLFLRSQDKGETWISFPGLQVEPIFDFLSVSASEFYLISGSSSSFYGISPDLLLHTTDAGQTWEKIKIDTSRFYGTGLRIDSAGHLYLFSGGDFAKLSRSDDQGKSWTAIDYYDPKGLSGVNRGIGQLWLDEKGGIFVATHQRLIYSSDLGKSWRELFNNSEIFIRYWSAGGALCTTRTAGNVMCSSDQGNSWEVFPMGNIDGLRLSGVSMDALYGISGRDLFFSRDQFMTRERMSPPEALGAGTEYIITSLMLFDGSMYLMTDRDFFFLVEPLAKPN